MDGLQPNVLQALMTIRAMAEVHTQLLLERHFAQSSDRLKHAEYVLKRVYQYSDRAIQEMSCEAKLS